MASISLSVGPSSLQLVEAGPSACERAFRTEHARQSHWERASKHAGRYCTLCNDLIAGDETMAKHERRRHWPCRACTAVFATSEGRDNHGRQQHQWCAVHKRAFINEDNYKAVSARVLLAFARSWD